mmetsp:Transcript_5465/g.16190  ORF Transcript_5465/g.16190 Transcript_5465/m.16190 type:complete len:86 (+) Transcript_5465:608-865(+)
MSEKLMSTDAESEIGRRMCRVMTVKEARAGAGDRRRSQKTVECGKCIVHMTWTSATVRSSGGTTMRCCRGAEGLADILVTTSAGS